MPGRRSSVDPAMASVMHVQMRDDNQQTLFGIPIPKSPTFNSKTSSTPVGSPRSSTIEEHEAGLPLGKRTLTGSSLSSNRRSSIGLPASRTLSGSSATSTGKESVGEKIRKLFGKSQESEKGAYMKGRSKTTGDRPTISAPIMGTGNIVGSSAPAAETFNGRSRMTGVEASEGNRVQFAA
ncbi:hypothetical protein HK097_003628 [Rhizophlyctis rosea]|uniref:Uncharacterized protein n=1 Tax=Rhizophlyctis rosea TaxID=64517 RepID=A0AAD5S252_9FUNG|nr:hypothetical protein HK097_003628 [Rhizophlyctis rosea]